MSEAADGGSVTGGIWGAGVVGGEGEGAVQVQEMWGTSEFTCYLPFLSDTEKNLRVGTDGIGTVGTMGADGAGELVGGPTPYEKS